MMKQTAKDFIISRVLPNLDAIDAQEEGLMPKLLEEAGELGLLSSSIPESLGGMGMDFKTSMIITEGTGGGHSYAVSYSAHTGIATLPILYYGNEAQKKKVHTWSCFRQDKRSILPY
jgi:alkylation response protein AidB-like acyl-CoA dehydrogenase